MRVEAPSRSDEVAAAATQVIGGPVGRYARVGGRGWVAAASTLSVLGSLLLALGVLQKNSCVRTGWATPNSLWRMCYSDLAGAAAAARPTTPYSFGGPGGNQPVLTATVTWIVQRIAPGSGLARQQWYFGISAMLLVLLVALTVCAIAWMLPQTPWRASFVALSPLLVTSALISFDLLGVALAAAGLAAWVRRHPAAAGVLLGAAVLARSYPLVLIAAIVLVGWRAGQRAELRRMLIAVSAVSAVIVICCALIYTIGGDPLAPYRVWWGQGSTYGSTWKAVSIAGLDLGPGALTTIAVLGFGLALVLGSYLVASPQPLPLVSVATAMLVVVMLTGKSNPVQSALWLLPLVAASQLPWREYLVWAGLEVATFAGTWLYVGASFDASAALPPEAYAGLSVVHLLGLVVLAWRIAHLARREPPADRSAHVLPLRQQTAVD